MIAALQDNPSLAIVIMPATTYYVALPFIASEDGPVPVDPVECQSLGMARSTAAALSRNAKFVGTVAFQRTGDPDQGEFSDAGVLATNGEVPNDLSAL